MISIKKESLIIAAILSLLPASVLGLSIEVTDRSDNEWGFSSDEYTNANANDCDSNVTFTFTVSLESASTSGRSFYLYKGSDCDDEPADCDLLVSDQSTSDLTIDVEARDLFDADCSDTSPSIWLGLLEEEDQPVSDGVDDEGLWSGSLSLSLDTTGPSVVPEGISATPGSSSVEISWDSIDNDAVEGFVVVYWDGASSSSDADTDTDTDTDADTDQDAGADDQDAGSTAFTFDPVPYADGDDEDTDADTCSVAGGPTAGGVYDPSVVSGLSDTAIANGSATSVTVSGLDNGTTYEFAVVSVDDHGNPSAFSEVVCVAPEDTTNFFGTYGEAGGSGGGFCFIATAAFGSYDHPVVKVLREFRDEFILRVPGGAAFVSAYYEAGPTMAAAVDGNETIRGALAALLYLFAGFALLLMSVGPGWVCAGLGGSVLTGLVLGVLVPRSGRGK